MVQVKVENVKFVKTSYPRDSFTNEIVNNYRLNLEKLPPIVVNKDLVLIDGYHRLLAYRLEGKTEIEAEILDVPPEQVLFEAARRNSMHGLQLARVEKQRLAREFYKQDYTQEQIADVLAISQQTISVWLSDLVKEAKEEQKRKILDAYLECKKLSEIADSVSLSTSRVSEIITEIRGNFDFTKFGKVETPESLQYYNVWYFARRDPRYGLEKPGSIPGQIVENILYYYTKPFDLVVDPMVGGGTTLDVCKAMARRCLAYDIEPIREDISQHDIQEGFPSECRNSDLIFLDPPYYNIFYKTFFGSLEKFHVFIEKLAENSYETVKLGGFVTFLMMNQTESVEGLKIDTNQPYPFCVPHVFDCCTLFQKIGFKLFNVISVPLTAQQYNAPDLERAKNRKWILGTYRDLLIFQKQREVT